MQHATGELENTAGLKTAKRDLARALTVARQRGSTRAAAEGAAMTKAGKSNG